MRKGTEVRVVYTDTRLLDEDWTGHVGYVWEVTEDGALVVIPEAEEIMEFHWFELEVL